MISPILVFQNKVWIEVGLYESVRDIRELMTGDNWKTYKKLCKKYQSKQIKTTIKIDKKRILITLPKKINTQDKFRKILSSGLWRRISKLRKKYQTNQWNISTKASRDFINTYKSFLYKESGASIESIAKAIYGDGPSNKPIITYILKRHENLIK